MAHTCQMIDLATFDAYVASGDFQDLYHSSKKYMLNGTVDYEAIFALSGDLDVDSIDDVKDENHFMYFYNKFRSYADPSTVREEPYSGYEHCIMARSIDGRLVEMKCCYLDHENSESYECNSLTREDASGSRSWIYSDAAGKAMYDMYRGKGIQTLVLIASKGSPIGFVLSRRNSYDYIKQYVDVDSIRMGNIVHEYTRSDGIKVDVEYIEYKINIKDY